MKVQEIMKRKIVTAKSDTPYRKLWEAILLKHVNSLPVIDDKNEVLGIICEADLLKPLYPDYANYTDNLISADSFESMEETVREIVDLRAKNIMARRIIFTRPDTPIMRALSRMLVHGFRQLPVLDDNNKLVGMISKTDVVKAIFRKKIEDEKQEEKELKKIVSKKHKNQISLNRKKQIIKSKSQTKNLKTSH